ncbi:uncharacterized protein LOC132698631 [Cylas formicarius]|uniref:uncharacterized protein LOC132698631 n=1 Tax=Cylas formicarius TaxID=197179 RepID=UPI00295863B4|nr:uncharacterized protein LOC132698631 [Cylas formicarius]
MSFTYEGGVIKCEDFMFDDACGGLGLQYFNALRLHKQQPAQINTQNDEFDTFSQLLTKTVRTSLELKKRGIRSQDLIAVCTTKQNLNACVPILAGQYLGAITFSLDPSLSISECSELLAQVHPKIIFVIDKATDTIKRSLENCGIDAEIISFGQEFELQFLQPQEAEDYFRPVYIGNLKQTAVIHFSSGTTGTPKPICLNHYYFLTLIDRSRKRGSGISLRFANFYWVSSSMELVMFTVRGGCRLLMEHFNADDIWTVIDKYKVTDLGLTPMECIELTLTTRPPSVETSSLKELMTGGQVLHQDYLLALKKLFPDTKVFQIYGMTEVGFATKFDEERLRNKPLSCGIPTKGLWYKVVDIETRKVLGPNRPGELMIKAKHMFTTFYNRSAAGSFDQDEFFKTGDMVYYDDQFCFFVVDRLKAILGWKDYLIYPSHIEEVLIRHPSVQNAVVIGIPHKVESERLLGVVVLKSNAPKVTEEELVRFVDERVPDHKRLREGVKFMDSFPTTVTGKICRRKIKEQILFKYYNQYDDLSFLNPRDAKYCRS